MARFEDIKSIINTYIKPNGKEEITGEVLQNVLRAMMEAVDIVVDEVVAAFPQISGSEFVDVLENKVSLLLDPQGHLGNTGRGLGVVMDKVMSDDSLNPVSNKVVKAYIDKIKTDLDALVGGDLSSAIDNFNEILEFLSSIEDSETLGGIIAGLETALRKYADGVAQAAYEQSYADAVGASSAYTDGKIAALAAVARTGSYNDLKDKPTIQGGGSATPRVEMAAESAAIEPNKFYVWPMMDELNLTLGAEQSGVMNRYLFQFRNPKAGLTMLTLPDDITWSDDTELDENGMPVMEAAAFYRIEIIEGLASLKKWKLVYIQFADAEVENILLAKNVGDGVGITKKMAEQVTDISNWFALKDTIKTFHEFQYFTNVTLLKGAVTINGGTGAFIRSTLEEITLPPSLTEIGKFAFAASSLRICNGLESVVIMGENVFRATSLEGVINMPNIEEVGTGAFSTTSIMEVADFGKVVTLPDAVYAGGKYYGVFAYCASLVKVTLPSSLQTIGSRTFIQDTALEDVYIGENVTTIGENAFNNCKKLVAVRCMAATPPILASNAFSTTNSAFIIYVPDASVESYKSATNWNSLAARILPMSEFGVYEDVTANYAMEVGQAYGSVGGSVKFTTDAAYEHTKAAIGDVDYVVVKAPSQASSLIQYVDGNDKILKLAVTNYPSSLTRYNIEDVEGATHIYLTSAAGTLQIWKKQES